VIICIAGKNNIAVEILLYLLGIGIHKEKICIIPNKTDDGSDNWQRSLLKLAKEEKIKAVTLEEVYDIENLLFLSLEFDKIIKPLKFKTKKLYNIHFSLLPKYKGMYTSIMPILNNEKETGVTLHKIDKGIDTGDIIAQKKFIINLTDNARDIYKKYIENGISLVKNNIFKLVNNLDVTQEKQNILNSSYFSKNSIDFNNIKIDLIQTAINIHNQIRAYNFREYQISSVLNHKIISSRILDTSSNLKVGSIILENDISITISTIDNDILLYKDKSKDLFNACANGSSELVNRLIQIPKIINVQDENGWTPLIISIYNNHKNIIKTFLMNGADINITNFKGTTILMYAKSAYILHGDDEILKLILNLDIDIYQKDFNNKHVIDYCEENKENKALSIIKDKIK
jgi:methionyl-tRNA formyltransferase